MSDAAIASNRTGADRNSQVGLRQSSPQLMERGACYVNPGAMAPQLGTAYQPTFAYEAMWDLIVFAILWSMRGRFRQDAQLFALYVSLYAIGKFALTFLRTEVVWLYGLQEAQLVALGVLLLAIGWWRSSAPIAAVNEAARA